MSAELEPRDTSEDHKPFRIAVAERVLRLPPYLFARINQRLYEKRRAGADVIDLGMGNPSDPPQDLVIDKLAEAAHDPRNHGYSPATGIMSLKREVAAKYLKKYGARIDPASEVIVTLGSKEGFSHLCLALMGPGDTAIVPAPHYPAHLYAVALASDGYQPPSFCAAPGAIDVGVEFTTMSKGYNMAGWRVGFAAGNAEMLRALATVKAYYDYGMFRPIQIAAILALRHTDAAVEAQAATYQRRRDVLCDGLARLGWSITKPRATMFVWAKIPEPWASQMGSMDFALKLLEEADVAASPGAGFGPAGEGYLRLALVENENRL